ncbi:hypothetical protein F2Q69_00063909 [Brassica cretica]|uniref:Uncharacterized protein n=1 Tax=Brassica cretica TaxID=69181 RepID=A0A8S9RG36_BRACR|nr:hypothetical protein F2Q69_00063909 [Brassica cretica]
MKRYLFIDEKMPKLDEHPCCSWIGSWLCKTVKGRGRRKVPDTIEDWVRKT